MTTNRTQLLYLAALLLFAVGLISCNNGDVDQFGQDRIFASYELFYDTNTDQTTAFATFRLDSATGIKLQLADGADVFFEGDRLSFNSASGDYERSFSGLTASGEFEYLDLEGSTYRNSVSINVINYPLISDTVQRSADYVLTWSGDALAANESVDLTVQDANSASKVFSVNAIGSTSVTADSTNLKELAAGLTVWYLDRIYSPEATDGTPAGAEISARFRPISQTVVLN